jgi:multidrug efflux pump subunit AcrB
VRKEIDTIVASEKRKLEAPDQIVVRGQRERSTAPSITLRSTRGVALIAIYFLIAVNFQSWGDPFLVIAALPLAFCGIVMSLFIASMTFSIPSLFGAIMSVGATSTLPAFTRACASASSNR